MNDTTVITLNARERRLVWKHGLAGDVLQEVEPQLEALREAPGEVAVRSSQYNWARVTGSMSYEVRVMKVRPRLVRLEVLDLCDRIDAEIERHGYRW
jgi:hypothetical protein